MTSGRRGLRRARLVPIACLALAVAGCSLTGGPPRSPAAEGSTGGSASVSSAPARPLVYADGSTIHVGNRTIDTRHELLSLNATADGAAFTTFDGALWFTDGYSVTRIGRTSPGRITTTGVEWGPAGRPNERIVSDDTGPDVAWLEYPPGELVRPPTIVVYDTSGAHAVVRIAVRPDVRCPACTRIVGLRNGSVYWTVSPQDVLRPDDGSAAQPLLFRFQLATRRESRVPAASYLAELGQGPRSIVVGTSYDAGTPGDGVGLDFEFVHGQLVSHALGAVESAYDPRTRRRLEFRAPPSMAATLGPADRFYLFQWLDDDRFALLDASSSAAEREGDVVVCRISDSSCAITVRAASRDRSPIVPGVETRGAELAEARLVEAASLHH